jgi:cytoskeleton-associated protein 5
MEIVLASLESCGGMISCAPTCIPGLVELVKVIADRLGDSQSNLKPLAATLIGSIFASVTSELKVKLGRIVFPYLVNAALTDSKQTMRDAAMTALVAGTSKIESEGGGPNSASLEAFLAVFVSSIKEADFKVRSSLHFYFIFCRRFGNVTFSFPNVLLVCWFARTFTVYL